MSIVALSYHVFHAKTSRHVSYLRKGKNVSRLDALPVTKYNVCAGARAAACAGACFLQIRNWKIVKVAPFGARQNMVSSNQKTGRAETIPTVFAPRACYNHACFQIGQAAAGVLEHPGRSLSDLETRMIVARARREYRRNRFRASCFLIRGYHILSRAERRNFHNFPVPNL